jgi:hypothetical protein
LRLLDQTKTKSVWSIVLALMPRSVIVPSRREFMMLWCKIVGWGPRPLARAALRWKLQAASRPVIVKRLAKLVRSAAG